MWFVDNFLSLEDMRWFNCFRPATGELKKLIVSKNHLCFIIVYHVFIMVNDVFNKCSSTVHHVSSLVHQFSSCLHIGSSVFINCWSMFIMFNHHFHDPLVLTHAPFRVKRQRRGHWQRQRLGWNCALRRRASEGSGATPGNALGRFHQEKYGM